MRFGQFPNFTRSLQFQSPDDRARYTQKLGRGEASWQKHFDDHLWEFEKVVENRSTEKRIHAFLEQHPYFLPGFGDLHHGPYNGIIASRLPVGASFTTDFAYIASNPHSLSFTCVEIESARKRLLQKDGSFHDDYLAARQRLTEWLFWTKQHPKEALDCWESLFKVRLANFYKITFRAFLVFGRRDEMDTAPEQERWGGEEESPSPNLATMTHDRLIQRNEYLSCDVENNTLAVCSYREHRLVVERVIN